MHLPLPFTVLCNSCHNLTDLMVHCAMRTVPNQAYVTCTQTVPSGLAPHLPAHSDTNDARVSSHAC